MSFNRRGGPDRRPDRPPRREGFDRPGGRGGYPPRDRPPREGGGDRSYGGGGERPYGGGGDRPYGGGPRGGDRPFTQRPRYDRDEGGMSIRLDPRRVNALKHLAGEAGMRPGDLVRQWVEERIDATRTGEGGQSLDDRLRALEQRLDRLESGAADRPRRPAASAAEAPSALAADGEAEESAATTEQDETSTDAGPDEPGATEPAEPALADRPARRGRVSATPTERVALHDEMIAVLSEQGPMTPAELATAIVERGRYAPPRSGKPLDAATVSQRASNPTYRSRFTRTEGRIALSEAAE